MNEPEFFKAAKACATLTLEEANGDVDQGLVRLYEKVTSHRPDQDRLQLMRETLGEFRDLYARNRQLTESLTPELSGGNYEQQVEIAAWTMVTHGLLNLDLAKVKR